MTAIGSLVRPAHYDWQSLSNIRLVDEHGQLKDVGESAAYEEARLLKAARFSRAVTAFLFAAIFLIWPLSMYGSGYVFSRRFFTGWVIVSVLWAFFALGAVTIYPIVELVVKAVSKPGEGVGEEGTPQAPVLGQQVDIKADSPGEEKKDGWVAE